MSALWTSDEVGTRSVADRDVGRRSRRPASPSTAAPSARATSSSRSPARRPTATPSSPTRCRAARRRPSSSRDVPGASGKLIRVADTMKALVDLGRAGRKRSTRAHRRVTGSVGKTSTKDALRAILSAQAPTSASTASFNNHVGVPISLARLPREARYGVFEIGMNHPGEIEPLARQVEAHVGVDHQRRGGAYRSHGQRGGDRRREGLPVRRHAAGRRRRAQPRQSPLRPAGAPCARVRRRRGSSASAGTPAAEARLVACRLQDSGSDVEALIGDRRIEYRLGAAGEHWVLNSLAALAVAEALGADLVAGRGDAVGGQGLAGTRRAAVAQVRLAARSSCSTRATTPTPRRCGRCWRCWRAPSRRRAAVACW